jgi:HAE1 family hydrophobic/amphiphilic exporter-1
MKIHEISIRRPVTVLMCVLIVLVLGFVSLINIPLDMMPNMEFPIAIVITNYSGVGPQEIESIVSKSVENAISTVGNIKTIQSQSSEGTSIVIAEFNNGTDMDFATLEMREKIDMMKGMLPDGVTSPLIIKVDINMMPIIALGVTNSGSDEAELKTFIEDKIEPRLERLDGVASVDLMGGKTREIKVEADPEKLAGYGTSLNSIIAALQSENLNLPGGVVEYGDKDLLVRSTGEFENIEQLKNIPITLPTGGIVYIRDIAEISDGYKKTSSYNRMNGENAIGLTVQKQTDANTVSVVNRVKDEIEKIKAEYSDLDINLIFDQGEFIELSLNSVSNNAVMGGILAVIILFIFLKNIRSTLIVATSIPISIIATFVLIYFSGTTLNIVSLGGLALGIGMLVDNAIVVIENIFRYRTEGHSRIEAAIKGTQEVSSAIIASTLTTIGVFVPIIFVQGMAGELFKEMALTVTFSLAASLVVALTFIPMLSSKLLKVSVPSEYENEEYKKDIRPAGRVLGKWYDALSAIDTFYRRVLRWVLGHRKLTVFIVAVIFVISLVLLPFIGFEFIPAVDQGMFSVNIKLPEGTQLDITNEAASEVEKILLSVPELEIMSMSVGSGGAMGMGAGGGGNTASANITLKDLNKRSRSTSEVVDDIRKQVAHISGAEITVTETNAVMMSGSPVSIKISGPDLDQLEEIADRVVKIVEGVEGTRQVSSSIAVGRPEAQVYVNRDKAAFYGLGSAQVASSVRTAVEGSVATTYKVGGEEVDVRVQIPEERRKTLEQLRSITISSPTGAQVPLGDIAEIRVEQGPVTITREGQERYVSVTAQIFGRDVGSINRDINRDLQSLALPSNYSIEMGGEQEQMVEAFTSLAQALLLAILLVYMIMAAQFESLLHPFVIMFSVPLAFCGSAVGLFITGRPLSVPGFIGVIMLAGIVVNNAIVLVDYINTLRKRGMDRYDAIIKAGPTRLRPILMTTLTTILGLIPLAVGIGEGAEIQAPMATVVIGGLTTSTVLTLVIVPVLYTLFDDISAKRKKRREAKRAARLAAAQNAQEI